MFSWKKHLRVPFFYFCIVLVSAFFFFLFSLFQVRDVIVMVEKRVQEDIILENGKWNTAAYSADPLLPGTAPIYVLASDGYVIERWKPITGFLDASDFKHLLNFTSIQTVETSTNQDWRVLSVPINGSNETIGVITLSYFHPTTENLELIDQEMFASAQKIQQQIRVEGDSFRIEPFDERKIPYYIAYQVVNKFNKIVFKSNNSNSIDRLPNFIDPSYISSQLNKPSWNLVRDERTQEIFLTKTEPLYIGGEGSPDQGVIVIGHTLSRLFSVFTTYIAVLTITGFLVYVLGVCWQMLSHQLRIWKKQQEKLVIYFDKKNSILHINETQISIEYASNQYYLTEAVLEQPSKRWEVDEIMDKFGEELSQNSWRKVYDAMISINRKTAPILNEKLILVEGKTFRLNPHFAKFVHPE